MGRFHRHGDGTAHSHDDDHAVHPDGDEHAVTGDHSGYQTGTERVEVLERIFDENDRTAAANRAAFVGSGACAINLMSSPGAGKTTLLRETLRRLSGPMRIGVIEGDIETSLDADRLAGFGADIALINTGLGFGGECHLDAPMVRSALPRLPLAELDLVLIENVGNLVCPAMFDLGERAKVALLSVTEGEDKPLKYPLAFKTANVVLVNKIDLTEAAGFDRQAALENIHRVAPQATVLEVSARTGAGSEAWYHYLESRWAERRLSRSSATALR
jgi:hydrogenase nickel incorporation protein HypB